LGDLDETLVSCAKMMELAARTAPKSAGQDHVVTAVLGPDEVQKVGDRMVALGEERDMPMFVRDGKSVKSSGAMLLVGLKGAKPVGLDCMACGYRTCSELSKAFEGNASAGPSDGGVGTRKFLGPLCAFRLLDMGIALGSAAKTAGILNADSRIMYRAGVVARELGFIDAEYVMAVPVSATGKSPFFDR
jgi:uncharacterized ferredoxin-like protein